jgi:hypothetical protein
MSTFHAEELFAALPFPAKPKTAQHQYWRCGLVGKSLVRRWTQKGRRSRVNIGEIVEERASSADDAQGTQIKTDGGKTVGRGFGPCQAWGADDYAKAKGKRKKVKGKRQNGSEWWLAGGRALRAGYGSRREPTTRSTDRRGLEFAAVTRDGADGCISCMEWVGSLRNLANNLQESRNFFGKSADHLIVRDRLR